ncbi:succinyldiaminopimelate transaminase [Kerstersia gyiorum]|uniref:Succinyldiaminopimelate aminotransferase n=1 Tax=Kerstersia gyiorum TaxID=206506 RepID=A0A171KTV6_9BURK|nr:succinyldiaminopimelate transaminase [Kerstersia gyiorum]KAB0543331.1 succinyldiaminopimelate transaminase [Kerstersia gyiorum]KKO72323.1 succinyldiaminopimelate aminotransferase [Kerstersia gyiorum]MCP1632792.1 N-succinyldiaminopimelate aminotransferase [Kerstersia gyiorum]MCP1635677.1 N-succinyldiaminopimelate aminotransferase [Kerstersia gyiorum]MCP1670916.1 N-succinyldiaminopimelate aminotransferase [Kerstersia gyiorum]
MNPRLNLLNPYPFEKLRKLLAEAGPAPEALKPIPLHIGEPRHAAPARVRTAMAAALDSLSHYPPTKGDPILRQTIADWLGRRYGIPAPDADTQVLPVLGSREALFAFAQVVVDSSAPEPLVVCPNPFYQIYEGAALLAGAQPYYAPAEASLNFSSDWSKVPAEIWQRTQLLYVCSPGNPAGSVIRLDEWRELFALSDRYGFVIASDECYSEIFPDEARPPLGALQAAQQLGRTDYARLVVFSSLSKRSNLPGLRSGFVAGDASLIGKFLLYRTYHGSAMSPIVTQASIAAWSDEEHVLANRAAYRAKFAAVYPILKEVLDVQMPDASFYLWAGTPIADTDFARDLYAATGVGVLPGSFLAREQHGYNPGAGRIRLALVAPLEECVEAAERIARHVKSRYQTPK